MIMGSRGTVMGDSDSAGIVTSPKSEFETVAGNVATVNVATVAPSSRTSRMTVATTIAGLFSAPG